MYVIAAGEKTLPEHESIDVIALTYLAWIYASAWLDKLGHTVHVHY